LPRAKGRGNSITYRIRKKSSRFESARGDLRKGLRKSWGVWGLAQGNKGRTFVCTGTRADVRLGGGRGEYTPESVGGSPIDISNLGECMRPRSAFGPFGGQEVCRNNRIREGTIRSMTASGFPGQRTARGISSRKFRKGENGKLFTEKPRLGMAEEKSRGGENQKRGFSKGRINP